MNQDLKIIKKQYGEKMSHLCRKLFPTLLESEGLLPELLLKFFAPSHFLYDDIIHLNAKYDFQSYIQQILDPKKEEKIGTTKTPKDLFDEAGYDLYECTKEEEIQSFKKYFSKGEGLCTFHGGRLNSCVVFFAVKKNVDEIKRENFKFPKRQDEYGTSVISIQFTKDDFHMLSIKNRYNHTVKNPDSTFSNNLDRIIPGLEYAFEKEYGLKQQVKNSDFELEGYVRANDGRYYKYNYEINNIYYCPDNIIIVNGKPHKFKKELYLVLDYFVLDLKNKKIMLYDSNIGDSFVDSIGEIQKIDIIKVEDGKEIVITPLRGENIIITINPLNQIIKLINNNVKVVGPNFLTNNDSLQKLELLEVEEIDAYCLSSNKVMKEFSAPNLKIVGDCFLFENEEMQKLELPEVEKIGISFLAYNKIMKEFLAPNLKIIGNYFLFNNEEMQKLELPEVEEIGDNFLAYNKIMKEFLAPNLKIIDKYFLFNNEEMQKLELLEVEEIGDCCLSYNKIMKEFLAPKLKIIGVSFLSDNEKIQKLELPEVKKIGDCCLSANRVMKEFLAPNLKTTGASFLSSNYELRKLILSEINNRDLGGENGKTSHR